jgi:hypothetical protein
MIIDLHSCRRPDGNCSRGDRTFSRAAVDLGPGLCSVCAY